MRERERGRERELREKEREGERELREKERKKKRLTYLMQKVLCKKKNSFVNKKEKQIKSICAAATLLLLCFGGGEGEGKD